MKLNIERFKVLSVMLIGLLLMISVEAALASKKTPTEQEKNENLFKGFWRNKHGTVTKIDGNKGIVIFISSEKYEGWLNKISFKDIRRKGNKWVAEKSIRHHKTGEFSKWIESELEITGNKLIARVQWKGRKIDLCYEKIDEKHLKKLAALRREVKKIPKEIRQVIFEKSIFSKPIFFVFPHKAMSLGIGVNWFIEHGFLTATKLEKPTMFVKYRLEPTDKLRPHIIDPSASAGYVVHLASRRLTSIDYTNSYDTNIMGYKMKNYAVTFSYTLDIGVPFASQLYAAARSSNPGGCWTYRDNILSLRLYQKPPCKGKAKALLDPDDGLWKLENMSLSGKTVYRRP